MTKEPGHNAIRLSVAMMVRDEEATLARSLASVSTIADEIIVVDTGSKDRSIEIARSFGARVYEHPWEKNFSLHRNQSIDYCSGDWIFIFDADEELILAKDMDLRARLAEIGQTHDAAGLILTNIVGGQPASSQATPRLFKRGTIRYEGQVHNQVVGKKTVIMVGGAEIRHYGYDPKNGEAWKRKFDRSRELMENEIRQDPANHDMLFHLNQLHADFGKLDEAISYGEQYLAFEDKIDIHQTIYFTMAALHIEKGQFKAAAHYIARGTKKHPDYIDLWYICCKLATLTNDPMMALNAGREYVELFGRYEKEAPLWQRRFLMTLTPAAVAFVSYSMGMAGLLLSSEAFSTLDRAMPHLSDEARKGIIQAVEENIPKMKVPAAMQVVPLGDPVTIFPLARATAGGAL
jgi:glycosyltransferase involved in cell wall biosynthesis